ncbi:MAG TPA: zf-HC2 domain-containing protein [Myxococcales bacterium]|nr:zf-HC2 domain-containing protein [Myxococcales bacterium]
MTRKCEEVVPLLGPMNDGALEADDRAWVEEHLRGCSSCSDRRAFLAAQGQALREVLAARAAAASFDGFADQVMARIEKAPRASAAERTPVWFREMWGGHKGAFAATVGVALAACMALGVFFMPPRQADDGAEADGQVFADATGPEVQEVDFGTHDGAVLQLPDDTTVIWMSDDKTVQQ